MLNKIQKLKEQAKKTKDNSKKTEIYKNIAINLWRISENKESKKYALLTLELSHKHNLKEMEAAALNTLGLIEMSMTNYSKSLDYFFQTLKVYESISNKPAIAITINNIGLIYLKMENKEKALEFFLKALDYVNEDIQKYDPKINTESVIINIGIVYLKFKKYGEALKYLNKALKFSRRFGLKRSIAISLVNIGEVYQCKKQLEKSLECFLEALQISQELNDKNIMIPVLNDIGGSYRKLKDYNKALEFHNKALKLALEIDYKEFIKDSYNHLSLTYEVLKDFKKSLEFYKLFSDMKDVIYTTELTKQIKEIHSSYEIEKKELEAKQMVEKAARFASIGVMAAGITHEINQPLNAIKISSESILFWEKRNPGALSSPFLKELKNISKAVARINDIIKHMRSFWARSDKSDFALVDLNKVIKTALSLLDRQLFSHCIEQEQTFTDELLMVKCNQIQIEQVIINLIVNAMRSLDKDHEIEKKIQIITKKENNFALIIVKDNGEGLPDNIGEKLYDPFFSTKEPGEGMGFGLAIVKNIIDKLNGTIKAENNEDRGVSFILKIPLVKEEEKNEDSSC